jgi:peroxisomal membrane protein 4
MTVLFKEVNKHNIKQILKMTLEHASNLGKFVCLYKLLCAVLERLYKKTSLNNFFAGMVCGYFVWGDKTPVNYQIVLYLFSRIFVALVDMAYRKYKEAKRSTPASAHGF